jgi:hypothetical protein
MDRQLYLIKVGRFSWADVDTMPLYEMNWYHDRLVELLRQAEEEAKANTGK